MKKKVVIQTDSQLLYAMDQYYGLSASTAPASVSRKSAPMPTENKQLHILLTTFWPYPHTGGLSNYISSYKKAFEALGHQVDVIAPNQFPLEDYSCRKDKLRDQLKLFFMERYGTYSSRIIQNLSCLLLYEELLKKLNLEKYDILHAQDLFTAFILTRLNRKLNKPLYFTPHGTFTKSRLKFNTIQSGSIEEVYYREIEKKAISGAENIIILADSFREPLSDYGAKPKQMVTVHTGIDMKKVRKTKKQDTDPLILSCVARLAPRKGHHYLLKALSMIRDHLDDIEVRIIGDGEMREALEAQADSLNLSCVRFLGTKSNIPDLLSESDLFVLPTINDNLPICLIEAMFAEQAIVTTNCGGITEIIHHKKTGMVAEPGDAKQLADYLLLLIKNKKVRTHLAKQAKMFAEAHLTSNAMAKKILDVYLKRG